MRESSRLENSSSAMPPKFMGREADSVMRWSLAKVKARSQKRAGNAACALSARLTLCEREHLEPDSSGLPEGLLDQRLSAGSARESITVARFSVLTIRL